MSRLQFATRWGLLGILLGTIAFLFNYHMVPTSLPGYEIIAAPAMWALSFFSEETPFWPKMVIFMSGQYIAYTSLFWLIAAARDKHQAP
ncbi:hypothetical protein [Thalassotalea euphylliae]|nr:hypothetical protein [Thalassotalea euphylliae]REL35284.1 hypothetical protein DXX92_07920 [Thalassotalea euphylliae]